MKVTGMSEAGLRSTSRTPSILQNGEHSPTPSKHSAGSALSPMSTKSAASMKLQSLKQRKAELDKLLYDKNNLLQQLGREEAQLLGCYPASDGTGAETVDGGMNTLRRKVDTSFKLSENLLNNGREDDVHKLLLAKQIQQQISEASLKMANDPTQTKSNRRAHKQNYEAAQQKLQAINKNLRTLKKRPNIDAPCTTTDDLHVHYHKHNNNSSINNNTSNTNNNNNNSNNNHSSSSSSGNVNFASSTNNNLIHGNISNSKYTTNSNQNHNNNFHSNNGNHLVPERRNSVISNSSSQHLASSQRSRSRCDSYSGAGASSEYGNNSTGKQSPSPSSVSSYYHSHLHFSGHNQLADKVMYLTNAVSNAAAAAASTSAMHSPKYNRLKNQLSVDTSGGSEILHYNDYMAQPQMKMGQYQQQQYSPRPSSSASGLTVAIDDDDDDDDDLAGQYATLMSISGQSPMDYIYQPMMPAPLSAAPLTPTSAFEPGSHYSVIGERSSMREKRSTGECDGEHMQSQGLGGYWMTLDNNERIWCSLDNKYSSLDRKSQKNKLKKQLARHAGNQPPTKSTSLGSFNFIARPEEALDAISIASGNSEHKRLKEKQWCETALDGPIIKQKMPSPIAQSPTSPMYWREKNKLSSHSMHSPGRNSNVVQSTMPVHKQPFPSPNSNASSSCTNLNKSLSNSATALSTTDSISDTDYYQYQQQMSPPYYHQASYSALGKAPAPLPHGVTIATAPSTPDMPLRRTVSSLSTNRSDQYPLSPTETQPTTPVMGGDAPSYPSAITSPTGAPPSSILANTSDIHIESPKNMTIVQQAKFQPYKEVTKPFEMSDFYKYSTKFRQKNTNASPAASVASPTVVVLPTVEPNSPQLPPKNINMMQHHRTASNATPSIATPYTIRYH